ncbi:MAG: ABC transporter ATP-binding protein [Tissierellia bacterium]|nr:ABC transporter ATP-binding protein [Tissierellia bacterium]
MKSNSLLLFIKEITDEDRGINPLISIFSVFQGFYPLINIIVPKYILDELTGQSRVNFILFYILILGIGNFIFQIAIRICKNKLDIKYESIKFYSVMKLGNKAVEMSVEEIEKKSTLDMIERGKDSTFNLEVLSQSISVIMASIITFISSMFILLRSDWRLILVVIICNLATIPVFNIIKELEVDNSKRGIPEERAFRYLTSVSLDFKFAKDLRLYGAREFFMNKAKTTMDKILDINHNYMTLSGFWSGVVKAIVQLQMIISFILLGIGLLTYQISIGSFTMLYGASNQLGESFNNILRSFKDLITYSFNLDPYYEIINRKTLKEEVKFKKLSKNSSVLIEFKDISFKYPTSEDYVLKNLSFNIKPGETLAIVGKNGAGKTTIIKLLCRLYKPTSGKILLNGIDIWDIEEAEYRKELSVVFQDFKLIPGKIDENLLCKSEKFIDGSDRELLYEKLKETGIDNWVSSLENKEKTFLTKIIDINGMLPSGGQEQKLAISRALIRDGGIVILDEPTAALDPKSEEEVFENLIHLSKDKTSIFISHRLSSTRISDRIIVLEKGNIIEEGTHKTLMEEEGLYSKMFNTQARQYIFE